jgi:hypothetical protein
VALRNLTKIAEKLNKLKNTCDTKKIGKMIVVIVFKVNLTFTYQIELNNKRVSIAF